MSWCQGHELLFQSLHASFFRVFWFPTREGCDATNHRAFLLNFIPIHHGSNKNPGSFVTQCHCKWNIQQNTCGFLIHFTCWIACSCQWGLKKIETGSFDACFSSDCHILPIEAMVSCGAQIAAKWEIAQSQKTNQCQQKTRPIRWLGLCAPPCNKKADQKSRRQRPIGVIAPIELLQGPQPWTLLAYQIWHFCDIGIKFPKLLNSRSLVLSGGKSSNIETFVDQNICWEADAIKMFQILTIPRSATNILHQTWIRVARIPAQTHLESTPSCYATAAAACKLSMRAGSWCFATVVDFTITSISFHRTNVDHLTRPGWAGGPAGNTCDAAIKRSEAMLPYHWALPWCSICCWSRRSINIDVMCTNKNHAKWSKLT